MTQGEPLVHDTASQFACREGTAWSPVWSFADLADRPVNFRYSSESRHHPHGRLRPLSAHEATSAILCESVIDIHGDEAGPEFRCFHAKNTNKEAFAMKPIAKAGIATATPSSRMNFAPDINRVLGSAALIDASRKQQVRKMIMPDEFLANDFNSLR